MTAPTTFSATVLCACGCGLGAPVPTSTDRPRGRIKGQPLPFRRGHQAKTRPQTPASIRFWRQVVDGPGECWTWTGYIDPDGYGLFNQAKGDRIGAHRFAYLYLIGPIPQGLDLDHLCRHKPCVNPWHTDPVPRGINVARANTARKTDNKEKTQ